MFIAFLSVPHYLYWCVDSQIILKELSSLTLSWMLCVKRLKALIASKVILILRLLFFSFREFFFARDRFPNHAFSWWWYWCWHGYSFDFKNPRGIPRQNDVHILCCTQSQGIGYRRWGKRKPPFLASFFYLWVSIISPTTQPSPSISSSKTRMRLSASITRPSTTSASGHSSCRHPPMVIWTTSSQS